jgi:ankyrin repeat protein
MSRDHFKRDLEPYVCISEECGSNLQYFVSLRDWQHHMNSHHTLDWIEEIHRPATWFCEIGDHDYQDFATELELRNHLQAAHSDRFNSDQHDAVVEWNVVYISRGHGTCPLCGTDVAHLLQNTSQPDPPSPLTKPQLLAKPFSSSEKPAKQLRFETPADPVNSDEEDYHEASDSRIDASDAGEPIAEDEQWRTNQIRLSIHIASHLKSLAFTSLRYFNDGNHDPASQESKRAASGDAGEKLSSEERYEDHCFELDQLDPTSFQDIPRDQLNDEEGVPPPSSATTAVWAAIRTERESYFAPLHSQDHTGIEPMLLEGKNNPLDLEEIFGTPLSEDSPDKHETLLVQQWVLLARRLLSPEELYFAMAAGVNPDTLGIWDSSNITPEVIRWRINYCSRGLIGVHKGPPETVQFIHESDNDLLRLRRLQTLDRVLERNPIGISHDRLKSCCMSYLMMETLQLPRGGLVAQDLASSYPFLQYASTYVFEHAEEAQARGIEQKAFLRLLQGRHGVFERVRLFHNSFEKDAGSGCGPGVSLLYVVSVHGYDRLVHILLCNGADVNGLGGEYGNALQAASVGGHEKVVRLLLDKGADINMRGGKYLNALQAASVNGHKQVVKLLLATGNVAVESKNEYGQTPLSWAARLGQEAVVKRLLATGNVDVESKDIFRRTPLSWAAEGGNEVVVKLLLAAGNVDVDSNDELGRTPLSWATRGGHEDVVKLLLAMGNVDVESKDEDGHTPLSWAARVGNEAIVKLLLATGKVHVESKDEYGQTPLSWAARGGHKAVVKLLQSPYLQYEAF